jgi:branched-chain amino acid transport system substrate-binding protein
MVRDIRRAPPSVGRKTQRHVQKFAPRVALGLLLALSGCGGGAESDGTFELVVGNLVPLRGDLAPLGFGGRAAGERAAADLEQALREAGSDITLRLVTADTETNDQIAEIVARQLVQRRDARCLVGDWATVGTFNVGDDVAAEERVPLISPASTNPELAALDDRGFVFRTAPSDDLQAVALAQLAAERLGGAEGRSIAVAGRSDAYARRFARVFAEAWAELGGELSAYFSYDPGLLDHAAEARRLLARSPDLYLVVDFPDSFARLAPDLAADSRYRSNRLLLPATMELDDTRDADIDPGAIEGATGLLPGNGNFRNETYDAVALCLLAAVAAGSNDGTTIRDRLVEISGPPGRRFGPDQLVQAITALGRGDDIDYDGESGPIDLDSRGDPRVARFASFEYRNGHPIERPAVGRIATTPGRSVAGGGG